MSEFFFGVWSAGSGAEYIWSTTDLQSFSDFQQENFAKGYYLKSLQISVVNGVVNYAAVVHPGTGAQAVTGACGWDAFSKWFNAHAKEGLQLTSISTCVLSGQVLYAGVMHPVPGTMSVQPATDWSTFNKWSTDLFKKGWRLTCMSTHVLNGQVQYAGSIGRSANDGQYIMSAVDGKIFHNWYDGIFNKGYRLTSVSTVALNGNLLYSGAVHPGTGGQFMSGPLPWNDFLAQEKKLVNSGQRLSAFLATEVLPPTRSWQLTPLSAGKVDFNGGSIVARSDGTWSFFGSLHDESVWYGDSWALGFALGNTAHGGVATGALGAKLSGPAVDGTFAVGSKNPWIAANWSTVVAAGVRVTLQVNSDPSQLWDLVTTVLSEGGKVIQYFEGSSDGQGGTISDSGGDEGA